MTLIENEVSLEAYIQKRIKKLDNGCWQVLRCNQLSKKKRTQYGVATFNRLVFQHYKGELPTRLINTCLTPNCVNPEHWQGSKRGVKEDLGVKPMAVSSSVFWQWDREHRLDWRIDERGAVFVDSTGKYLLEIRGR